MRRKRISRHRRLSKACWLLLGVLIITLYLMFAWMLLQLEINGGFYK